MAARFVREFAIKGKFESKIEGPRCAHSGEGGQAVVTQGRFALDAADTPSRKTRPNFGPQSKV